MAGSFYDIFFGGKQESIKEKAQLSISDVLSVVDTGDILLFRGWSPTSSFIQIFTASTWSHIALIIRLAKYNNGNPMVLESIHSDDDHVNDKFIALKDIITNKPHCGVRLIDLKEYLNSIVIENRCMAKKDSVKRIEVVLRSLTIPKYLESIQDDFMVHLNTIAAEFIDENRGKKYEENFFEIGLARLQFMDTSGYLTPDTLFCSELVGMFLLKTNLIDLKYITPNALLPDDFSASNRLIMRFPIERIPLLQGQIQNPDNIVVYSNEFVIDTTKRLPKTMSGLFC